MSAPLAPIVTDPLPAPEGAPCESDGEDSAPAVEQLLPPPAYHEIVAEADAAAAAAAIAAHSSSGSDGYASSTCSAAAEVGPGEEEGDVSSVASVAVLGSAVGVPQMSEESELTAAASDGVPLAEEASAPTEGEARVAQTPSATTGSAATLAPEQKLDEELPPATAGGSAAAEILADDSAEDKATPIEDAAAAEAASMIPEVVGEVPQVRGVQQQSTAPAAAASVKALDADAPADSTAAPTRGPAVALPGSASAVEAGASLRAADAAGSGMASQSTNDAPPEAVDHAGSVEGGSLAPHDVGGDTGQSGTQVAGGGELATEKRGESAVKRYWSLIPDGEAHNMASVFFFVLFFAFICGLRSLNARRDLEP